MKNETLFQTWVDANKDPYGKICVDVAREVIRLLDTPAYAEFSPHDILCDAEENIGESGMSGFQAGAIAGMVTECSERGEEFKEKWNHQFDEKPHEGAINPAILTIGGIDE